MSDRLNGKIVKSVGGNYEILLTEPTTAQSTDPIEKVVCRARGVFRHDGETPLVGDNIILKADQLGNFVIDEICGRTNSLIRPPMANLDMLFVMFAARSPEPVLLTVDKLISIAEHNKIEPVMIITKNDLGSTAAEMYAEIYKKSGFKVFIQGEGADTSELDSFIKQSLLNKTAAFAGASGIGKSTLLNRLFPNLNLATGEISRKIERGKHTTRSVELYPIEVSGGTGFLADTPGFSMLDFERFDFFTNDELVDTFREFKPYIGGCRYTKCSHTKEDDCAVIEAVRSGIIPKERHESFVAMREVLKAKKSWSKK